MSFAVQVFSPSQSTTHSRFLMFTLWFIVYFVIVSTSGWVNLMAVGGRENILASSGHYAENSRSQLVVLEV